KSDIIRFFMFYFVCGMAGAITHMIFYSTEILPLVGASGAISGLMGGAARFMFISGGFYGNRYVRLSPFFDSRIMIFAIVFLLINIVFGTIGSNAVQSSGLIAWQAHIGGFLAGLLLFGFFDRVPDAHT
ncbi:MAG TPA: rhomboid family intramembrane serine protease, partial [Nitrospirales bacterium]|nr:rhomboid family intramembrane serine protease [Nitrospirales bacterium]